MLDVNVGDKVSIEAIVTRTEDAVVNLRSTNDGTSFRVFRTRITKVLSSPPKVGDTVWWDADPSIKLHAAPYYGCTLRYVHQADGDLRKWGVVAFQGDIPQSIDFKKLRKTREACAD